MLSQFAALALSLTAAMPAAASDWYYVDADARGSNISFIDMSSIRTNAAGDTEATMFSVMAKDEEGAAAYRFVIEFRCAQGQSRLMTGQMFDSALKSDNVENIGAAWEPNDPGTQGETILKFVCSKGASYPDSKSLGDALPLAKGRAILAERAAKKGS